MLNQNDGSILKEIDIPEDSMETVVPLLNPSHQNEYIMDETEINANQRASGQVLKINNIEIITLFPSGLLDYYDDKTRTRHLLGFNTSIQRIKKVSNGIGCIYNNGDFVVWHLYSLLFHLVIQQSIQRYPFCIQF